MAESAPPAETERFQTNLVVTFSMGHAVHDTYTSFLAPLLPAFINNLLLSRTEAGLLAVFMQTPSLLQPVLGHLADSLNLRYLVILAPAVTGTMMSLLGVAPSYIVLALLLTVAGFSSASLHAVGPAIAGNHSGRNLGRGMSYWMVGGELGRALGPILVVTIVGYFSLKSTPWLMLLGWLASFILYVRLRDLPSHSLKQRNGEPWRSVLKSMQKSLFPLIGVIAVSGCMHSALMIYLPTYLTEKGDNLWLAGASLSVLQAAGVAGAFLGGSISDRLGRKRVLFLALLITPLFMYSFTMSTTWLRFPILTALGLSAFTITPVNMALVQETFPENRAFANGLFMAVNFTVHSIGAVTLGAVGDMFGLNTAFVGTAILMLLGLPFIYFLPDSRARIGNTKA